MATPQRKSLGNYISEKTVILRRGAVVEMGATDKVFGNPQHPYTKMLLASVPQLHSKWEELDPELKAQITELAGSQADRQRYAEAGRLVLPADGDGSELVEVERDHLAAPV